MTCHGNISCSDRGQLSVCLIFCITLPFLFHFFDTCFSIVLGPIGTYLPYLNPTSVLLPVLLKQMIWKGSYTKLNGEWGSRVPSAPLGLDFFLYIFTIEREFWPFHVPAPPPGKILYPRRWRFFIVQRILIHNNKKLFLHRQRKGIYSNEYIE